MANQQQRANTDDTAEAHARRGQSLAQSDTGDGTTGVRDGEQGMSNRPGDRAEAPVTEAGTPQRQDQSRTSLDTTSESGRARDEGPDTIERTGPQRPTPGPDATAPSTIDPTERETL